MGQRRVDCEAASPAGGRADPASRDASLRVRMPRRHRGCCTTTTMHSRGSTSHGEPSKGTVVRSTRMRNACRRRYEIEGVIYSRRVLPQEGDDGPTLSVGAGPTLELYVMMQPGQDGHYPVAAPMREDGAFTIPQRDRGNAYRWALSSRGPVVDLIKGGLIVDVKGVRGFIARIPDFRSPVTRGAKKSAQTLAPREWS